MKNRFPPVVVFWLLLFLLAACQTAPPVLKIGLVAPFEGPNRAVGYDAIYSARLAVREINEQGGIGGYRVALVALDDGGDAQLAAETAAALILDPDVIAVIGHGLATTTAAAQPLYTQAQLPFWPLLPTAAPTPLSADFLARYAAVTPFDETAGPYAGPTYEAFQQLFAALQTSYQANGRLGRASFTNPLPNTPIPEIN